MNNQKISNQELFENFLVEHFKEKLIFSSKRVKKGLASMGAMYFIQQTKVIGDEEYYIGSVSPYYPRGMISKNLLISLLIEHSKLNPMEKHEIDMFPVGREMGVTRCRCCNESLGNGGGHVIFEYQNKKFFFTLTGGAQHYLEHKIHLNLISYSFIEPEKDIKLHTQFVGDVKDIFVIQQYLHQLDNINHPVKKLKH